MFSLPRIVASVLTLLIALLIFTYIVQAFGVWANYPPCDPGLGPVRVPDLSGFRAIRLNRV